jgi:hypothetical protein
VTHLLTRLKGKKHEKQYQSKFQSVEQRTENPCVAGSIPAHTTEKKDYRNVVLFGFSRFWYCATSFSFGYRKVSFLIVQERNLLQQHLVKALTSRKIIPNWPLIFEVRIVFSVYHTNCLVFVVIW